MGTVPAPPTIGVGSFPTAAQLNQYRDAINFMQSPPCCYGVHSVSMSVPNNNAAWDLMLMADELYDSRQSGDAEQHSITVDTSRIYARTAGKLEIEAQITYAANATGARSLQIRKNSGGLITGGTEVVTNKQGAVSGVSTAVATPVVVIPMAVGDYVEVFTSQTSGGALATVTGAGASFLRTMWRSL